MQISRVPEKGKVATPQSMDASFDGAAYLLERLSGFSICAEVTDDAADLIGTLSLEASNNAFADTTSNSERADAVWVPVASSDIALDGGNDSVMWNVSYANYEAVRIVWTRTSGTGSISAYFLAKE